MDNLNKQIYDKNWESWRHMKVYGPASRWLRALIDDCLDAFDRRAIGSVLDVGCGEGTTTDMLSRRLPAARVLGVDFSETGIAMAKRDYEKGRVSFALDPTNQRLQPGSHDLVTCFEVLEHVDDWQELLEAICSAARKGVMLSFPTGRMRPFEVHVGHVRNFTPGEVEAFMEKRGFEPGRIFYAGFPFFSPFYRDLCNRMNAASNDFTRGRYGFRQKAVGAVLYAAFRYLSLRTAGDQFCGAFVRRREPI